MATAKITPEDKQKLITRYFGFYLDNFKSVSLKAKVMLALTECPEYFWTIVNYGDRSPDDEKKHSLLRRTAKTVYYAKILIEAWELGKYKEEILAAAVLNDLIKYETKWNFHGPPTARWLDRIWGVNQTEKEKFVLKIVELHDGRKWVSENTTLPKIREKLSREEICSWLVHTAVVVASRQKTSFDWNEDD